MAISVSRLYGEIWGKPDLELNTFCAASQSPRSPDCLFEQFAAFSPDDESVVLDIGCGSGSHVVGLAQRFGCRVIGIDPTPKTREMAQESIDLAKLSERAAIKSGSIEVTNLASESIDYIWCRDMLYHSDLTLAFRECRRVLRRPYGRILIYHTFATELLETREAHRMGDALAILPENMDPSYFEQCVSKSGPGHVSATNIRQLLLQQPG